MSSWHAGWILSVSLAAFPATACGTESSSHDNPPPPQFRLGGEQTAILPDARGRAELVLPEGETLLAFLPTTLLSGTYAFSLAGTGATEGVSSAFQGSVSTGTRAAAKSMVAAGAAPATLSAAGTAADERIFTAPAGRDKQGFIDVTAYKVAEGNRAIFYSEEDNAMVRQIAQNLVGYFDSVVYPESTLLFGPIPDVDQNGKVILLATSAVNHYSDEPGQFTGGFFASKDLNARAGSNHADMLYLYLPRTIDEGGVYDHPEEYERLSQEVIVHELQHMINYGEKLSRGSRLETSWLNEGLSHYAEAHFGFHRSNTIRAGHFLKSPDTTPLVGKCATLAERGAAFLFVQYLVESSGDPMILQKLVRTGLRGGENLEQATGKAFSSILRDWTSHLYTVNHESLKVEDVEGFAFDAKLPQSAPKFVKVRGPGVLSLRAEPKGVFQGFGFVLPEVVAATE